MHPELELKLELINGVSCSAAEEMYSFATTDDEGAILPELELEVIIGASCLACAEDLSIFLTNCGDDGAIHSELELELDEVDFFFFFSAPITIASASLNASSSFRGSMRRDLNSVNFSSIIS
jgi:hypothetical protein